MSGVVFLQLITALFTAFGAGMGTYAAFTASPADGIACIAVVSGIAVPLLLEVRRGGTKK